MGSERKVIFCRLLGTETSRQKIQKAKLHHFDRKVFSHGEISKSDNKCTMKRKIKTIVDNDRGLKVKTRLKKRQD